MAEKETLENGGALLMGEIDTSAPFVSVKEAVSLFGAPGFWKPTSISLLSCDVEEVDIAKVEEQAAEVEKELILKERDTLEVLKELEATKVMIEELKSKLQTEETVTKLAVCSDLPDDKEKENYPYLSLQKLPDNSNLVMISSSGMILRELKQAKLNLTKTTSDLAEIRASVESYNKRIERERTSLEKTRERLRSNTSKISSLEEEIDQTRCKVEEANNASDSEMMLELQRLNTEAEKYNEIGEVAKSELMKVMSEIELTKAKIKTVEIRLVAAQKMKEASRSSEVVALAEINALEKSENSENTENVTLTLEEYSYLKRKARDADELSNLKFIEAMFQVDEANVSKEAIFQQVEQAMEEVETSKKVLEDALSRVESANSAKLAVEMALRKWRSDNGEKRRSLPTSTKFKNPFSSTRRRDSWMVDLNGINLVGNETERVLKPSLSIGQILSRKLLITEEYEPRKSVAKRKVSLGQMLGKRNGELSSAWKIDECGNLKKLPPKRKMLGFARFSMFLPKRSKKKKQRSPISRLKFLSSGCKGELQEVHHFS